MIPNITIGDLTIDCANPERARDFYAALMGCEKITAYDCPAIKTEDGLTILFAEPEISYEPPVWTEKPGKQQKQMHLNFQVDDLEFAVAESIRIGATKAAEQYGGDHFVTMLDTEGHPFCLCAKSND